MFIISAYYCIINGQILNKFIFRLKSKTNKSRKLFKKSIIIIIIFRKYIIKNKNKVVGPNFLNKFN